MESRTRFWSQTDPWDGEITWQGEVGLARELHRLHSPGWALGNWGFDRQHTWEAKH